MEPAGSSKSDVSQFGMISFLNFYFVDDSLPWHKTFAPSGDKMERNFMKYAGLLLTVIASTAVFAKSQEYAGSSKWHRQGNVVDGPFGLLEELGVQRAAEKDALAKCVADGATDCVIASTENAKQWYGLTCPSCAGYTYFCSAQALARGEK